MSTPSVVRPHRIQRRRSKGWRLPPNTVCVDRSTKWGNPFIVGVHGTRVECVAYYRLLAAGSLMISRGPELVAAQRAAHAVMATAPEQLRGKNLACFCPLDQPCHADVLLEIANSPRRERRRAS